MYALADCNNFFVSCERLFRPDLNGRPVIVLSNNDGCAIARSNEAKALGIGMGAPLFKIADIVRRNHVVVFSGNMALYGDISRRVQQTLMEFTPAIERYSIDEAFLDLRGMETADFDALAKEISRRCLRNTGIPVSVGIAPTKTLAKIASKLCKRYPKLRGGCYMYRPEDVEKVLRRFPVEDVWGIGRRFSKRLIELGIKTAYDFTTLSPEWVRAQMSVTGMRTWRELRGEACIGFEDGFQAKQSICTSRSFATEIYEFDALAEQVAKFASMTAEKLRRQHSACNQMTVFAWTNRFKEDWTSNRGNSCVTAFETATDSSIEMVKASRAALGEIFARGCGYKKAGVIATLIIPKDGVQANLFGETDIQRHDRLMRAMDAINGRLGHDSVIVASQGFGDVRNQHQHRSPRYTTEWSDIPTVSL
mgnify:FL=1